MDLTDPDVLARLQRALRESPLRRSHLQPLPEEPDDHLLEEFREALRRFARPEQMCEVHMTPLETEDGRHQVIFTRNPKFRARSGSDNTIIRALAALESGRSEPFHEAMQELANRHQIGVAYYTSGRRGALVDIRLRYHGRRHLLELIGPGP